MKQLITISTILIIALSFSSCDKAERTSANNSGNNGTSGSLTRFITVNDYLYVVDKSSLKTYKTTSQGVVELKNEQQVDAQIETIFEHKNQLLIGSSNAMFIYSLSNPEAPSKLSSTQYRFIGHDPIVAIDSVAYSSLKNIGFNGIATGGTLTTFNIKNPSAPINSDVKFLYSPNGLDVTKEAIYVCDGDSGIAVFNRANPLAPILVSRVKNYEKYLDIIVSNNYLVSYIKGGLAFHDITNKLQPTLLTVFKN